MIPNLWGKWWLPLNIASGVSIADATLLIPYADQLQKGPWKKELSKVVGKATRWRELPNFCSVDTGTSQACLKHMQGPYPSCRAHIGVHEETVEHGGFFINQLHISPFKKLKEKRVVKLLTVMKKTKNDPILNYGNNWEMLA